MKKISRVFLFGALVLVLISTACAAEEGTPTVVGTLKPGDLTGSPSPAATDGTVTAETKTATTPTLETTSTATAIDTTPTTDTTLTPSIPVTGEDVILLECQFCVDQVAQALLVMPETTTFEVLNSSASLSTTDAELGCNTVDTFNNRQVVLCRAPEDSSITLNLCTDTNTCTELLVTFQTCPDVAKTPEPGSPTNTPAAGAGTATSTPTPATSPTPEPPTVTPTP